MSLGALGRNGPRVRDKSQCKEPEMGSDLRCSGNSKKARVEMNDPNS